MPTMRCEGNAKFEFSISEHETISNINDELDQPYAVGKKNKPTVGPSPFKEEGKETMSKAFWNVAHVPYP